MKGTRFWPSPHFCINRILLFETSEDKPTVDRVSYMIRNYGMQGASSVKRQGSCLRVPATTAKMKKRN